MNLVRIILLISILLFGLSNLIKAQLIWQNQLPQGYTLNEVYVLDEINAIVIGEVRTIIKTKDGGSIWNSQTGGGCDRLISVYSSYSNNV